MSHLLKSPAAPSKHKLCSTMSDTIAITNIAKPDTVSCGTQTTANFSTRIEDDLKETVALATKLLQAANSAQRSLTDYILEASSRLTQFCERDSDAFSGMTLAMETFAEDFERVTNSAKSQIENFGDLNRDLAVLHERYIQALPALKSSETLPVNGYPTRDNSDLAKKMIDQCAASRIEPSKVYDVVASIETPTSRSCRTSSKSEKRVSQTNSESSQEATSKKPRTSFKLRLKRKL